MHEHRNPIESFLYFVVRLGAWCGGILMLAAAALIGTEVILRKVFLVSLGGADEMACYALAIGAAWSFSFALLERAHIRVDALYLLLPERVRSWLDLTALLSLVFVSAALTWFAAHVLLTSWKLNATSNTPIGTPLWIPQGLWWLGLLLFLCTASLLLARAVRSLRCGDAGEISRMAGTRTIGEEMSEKVAHASRDSDGPAHGRGHCRPASTEHRFSGESQPCSR